MDDARLGAAQPRGAALPVAGRDADDPGPLPRPGSRSDRRRTGNHRPDLERALQPQDAGRPHSLSRSITASGSFENMLKETIFAATQEIRRAAGADDWCVSVFEDNAGVVRFDDQLQRRLQGRNAQPSLGPRALRRGEHRHRRRDPRPDGHRPRRQADRQHRRLLLRPARHSRRSAAARRAPSAPRDEGRGRPACATTATAWASPPSTARSTSIPATSAIRSSTAATSALIPRDKSRKQPQRRRPDRRPRRTHRTRRHPRRHLQLRRTDQPERDASPAAPCRSATPSPRRCCSTCCWRPATAASITPSPTAAPAASPAPSARWANDIGAEVWLDRVPAQVRRALLHRDLDLRGPGTDGPLRAARDSWDELRSALRVRGRRGHGHRPASSPTGRLVLKYHGPPRSADLAMDFLHDGRPPVVREAVVPARRRSAAAARWPSRRRLATTPTTLAARSSARSTWPARNGSSASTTTRCRAAAWSSRWSAWPTTARATPPCCGPCSTSRRGLVVACGMNPRYGDLDPYWMAASAIDEAVRNCVAVGADPDADRHPRQLLLGQHRPAGNARLAGARRPGLPRRGHRAGHAVHQRQGQPQQRVPPGRRANRSPFRRRS